MNGEERSATIIGAVVWGLFMPHPILSLLAVFIIGAWINNAKSSPDRVQAEPCKEPEPPVVVEFEKGKERPSVIFLLVLFIFSLPLIAVALYHLSIY